MLFFQAAEVLKNEDLWSKVLDREDWFVLTLVVLIIIYLIAIRIIDKKPTLKELESVKVKLAKIESERGMERTSRKACESTLVDLSEKYNLLLGKVEGLRLRLNKGGNDEI